MPQPYGRDNLSPEDLARQVAEHLAETSQKPRRFSLKNSVLVGRFMTGALVLGLLVVGVLAVIAGGNWLLDRAGEREPEVLAIAPIGPSVPDVLSTTTSTLGTDFLLAVVTTGDDGEGPEDDSTTGRATFLPALPSPTTTTPGVTTPPSSGPGPTVTQPGTTPSTPPRPPTTLPSPTTSTTSGNTASTTLPSTSTTQPTTTEDPTTTTTLATTTTSEATTTTVAAVTSTTCGNNGGGNGNCGR